MAQNWTFVIFGAIHGVVLAVERHLFPVTMNPVMRLGPILWSVFFRSGHSGF